MVINSTILGRFKQEDAHFNLAQSRERQRLSFKWSWLVSFSYPDERFKFVRNRIGISSLSLYIVVVRQWPLSIQGMVMMGRRWTLWVEDFVNGNLQAKILFASCWWECLIRKSISTNLLPTNTFRSIHLDLGWSSQPKRQRLDHRYRFMNGISPWSQEFKYCTWDTWSWD